jgi:hypothetical protein
LNYYQGAKEKILTFKGGMNPIEIKRGIKKDFPLSPILFDLCIDPLFDRSSSEKF